MGSKGYLPISISMPASGSRMQLVLQIARSLLPLLSVLGLYGLNKVLHIQPSLEDLGCVHVHTINSLEGFVLGCHPHRLVAALHTPVLDVLSTVPYLIHYAIPVLTPLYLIIVGRAEDVARLLWLIGWVMWFIFFIWLVFPHAPPWVVDHMNTSPNGTAFSHAMLHREGCAFRRVDKMFNIHFFYDLFSGNPVPYGSFPSGHVAWPFSVYLIGGPGGNWFLLYVIYMSWATLYTCHHYITDTIGAIILVLATRKLINYLSEKQVCGMDFKCRPNSIACPFTV